MNEVMNQSMNNYIDMVRNHKEVAFLEGAKAMRDVYLGGTKGHWEPVPENPYKIKGEKKDGNI